MYIHSGVFCFLSNAECTDGVVGGEVLSPTVMFLKHQHPALGSSGEKRLFQNGVVDRDRQPVMELQLNQT